jgi:1-acyl-sn-glycerol-3-phosphate acyltransferase
MNFLLILRILLVTIAHALRSIKVLKKGESQRYFELSRIWSLKLLKIVNTKVKVHGLGNIDKENYLLVCNHQSYFDIPILLSSIPKDFCIIYKQSLEKVPVFGKSLKLSPFISIDRKSPRKAIQSLLSTKELFAKDVSVLIFPEGSRSEDGKLSDFKQGALKIAEINKVKILPITLVGANKIKLPAKSKINKNVDVEVFIHEAQDIDKDSEFLNNLKKIINSKLN